jgi:DNA (cytosine-5)-methyltransferase 1
MNHSELLNKLYDSAISLAFDEKANFEKVDVTIKKYVEYIVSRSESNKGMVTVLTTLLVHKAIAPEQDIRYHQAGMENGFAGRGIDQSHVTPFMKKVAFPAMAESGWLTRSLEQAHPYTLEYPGKITPKEAKEAFLTIIDKIQTKGANPHHVLLYMFVLLIRQRDSMKVELAKPHSLSISAIISLLEKHFTAKYASSGASRLPTLAVYAAYQCMMEKVSRYNGKILCPLESHNSSDTQSGRIGDVDVNNPDNTAFEGIEIKHGIPITKGLVTDAYEKFKIYNTDRYYLLTTANMDKADWNGINEEISRISQIHGCQVIVNGVYDTLKYYLRLLSDSAEFIERYVDCMKADDSIKFQHKTMWNDVVSRK